MPEQAGNLAWPMSKEAWKKRRDQFDPHVGPPVPMESRLGRYLSVDRDTLDLLVGQPIKKICLLGYTTVKGDAGFQWDNHCAHFVSHVLGFKSDDPRVDCADRAAEKARDEFDRANRGKKVRVPKLLTGAGIGERAEGVCMRVDDLFPRCPTVGPWKDRPATLDRGLVFFILGKLVTARPAETGGPGLLEKRLSPPKPIRAAGYRLLSDSLVPRATTYQLQRGAQKHVGIFIGDDVWHFSNSRKMVVRQPVADLETMYGPTTQTFYGEMPSRDWTGLG